MSAVTTSRVRRIIDRIADVLADMDHAQRRLLEIQTGMTGLTRQRGRRTRTHDNEHVRQL
jgi:hypothetical protein